MVVFFVKIQTDNQQLRSYILYMMIYRSGLKQSERESEPSRKLS
jgi:hypothetical protein